MENWFLPKITDYWDRDSIEKYALEITTANPKVRAKNLEAVQRAVGDHVKVLPEPLLLDVLWIVADNLFRVGNTTSVESGAVESYLVASAGTLFTLARKRKCILHYLVDNIYEQTEFGMRRPLGGLYESWFRSAGLAYICPQMAAISLMIHDKQDVDEYFKLMPKYIDEAIDVAWLTVEKCHTEAQHYVFLNADSSDKPFSFECCMKVAGSPGIVTALRTEAPVAGSKVSVTYPKKTQREN